MDPQSSPSVYIPSTLEKKRAIACILFMGILISLVSQKKLSPYEYYYLAISIGRRSLGLLIIMLVLLSLLVSFFLFFSLPLFLMRGVLGAIIAYEAWMGNYNHTYSVFRFCAGLGSWLLSLFDIQKEDDTSHS